MTDSTQLSPEYKHIFGFNDDVIAPFSEIWGSYVHPEDRALRRKSRN